jgi:hypothetical protein
MRFDVICRMCKALGCFDVLTHPLFVGLQQGFTFFDVLHVQLLF